MEIRNPKSEIPKEARTPKSERARATGCGYVAQVSNLLYRRFPIGRPCKGPEPSESPESMMELRTPNSELRKKSETRSPNGGGVRAETILLARPAAQAHSELGFRPSFGLRISAFGLRIFTP
jgi:hypothetical protein